MAVDSMYMTSISATAVTNAGVNEWHYASATLTVYTPPPQRAVWAQISVAREGSLSPYGHGTSKAFIPRISIAGIGDLELPGDPATIGWPNVESITFELDVSALFATRSIVAPIIIATSVWTFYWKDKLKERVMAHHSPEPIDYPKITRVVYDVATGYIVHIHQVMALPGAEVPDGIDIDAQARSLASQISGKSEEELGVLNVKAEEVKSEVGYAVDLDAHRLIEIWTKVPRR
jgi:hypothetical protein